MMPLISFSYFRLPYNLLHDSDLLILSLLESRFFNQYFTELFGIEMIFTCGKDEVLLNCS